MFKNRRKIIFLTVLLIGLFQYFINIAVANDHKIFLKANSFYKSENYQEALPLYSSLLKKSGSNFTFYFNLASTYFKLSDIGRSLANYKRAALLQPRDKDTLSNIKYLRSLVESKIEDKRKIYIRVTEHFFSFFRESEFFIFLLISISMTLTYLLVTLLVRNKSRISSIRVKKLMFCLIILNVLACLLFYTKKYIFNNRDDAVIVQTTNVYHSPYGVGKVAFKLKAGVELKIVMAKDDWARVKLINGSEGWINNLYLEKIDTF